MSEQTLSQAYTNAVSANYLYTRNKDSWQFLLDSWTGGDDYRQGQYLQRYNLETDKEYALRLKNTPLDNQCRSLISLYISFLFRQEPSRDFGTLDADPTVEDILEDADLDGRSMNAFMKDVATFASIMGHCWVCVAKPKTLAVTRADEQALGVRPYLSLHSPLTVTDWTWEQQPNGGYQLSYIKLVEEVNDTFSKVVEWTKETITTTTINVTKKSATDVVVDVNELGRLPFVCVYAERSLVRGLGNSLITDIAEQQRMIYNELAEVYDSIRLDTHPSLVATSETNVQGASAGQVITMPENLDSNLKPYVLQFQGGQIDKIYQSIQARKQMIDTMGNVGAVRSTQTNNMSGIAIETEFQLLNARLSSIADNLELGEEQIWQEISQYLNTQWTGEIEYPSNFALKNSENTLTQLTTALSAVSNIEYKQRIETEIMSVIELEDDDEEHSEMELTLENKTTHIQDMIMQGYEDLEILDLHTELSQTDITTAKQALLNLNG